MLVKKIVSRYKKVPLPVKAAFWYTFCNFFNKAISLLATPIFTRIMTEAQYGTFSIFQSWFNILIVFTSLNIFMAGFTKGLLENKKDQDNFVSSQLALTSLITIIFLVVYGINTNFWTNIFDLPPVLMYVMFAELFFMPAFEFWMAKKRLYYDYKKVVVVSIFMNIACLVTSVIAVLNVDDKVSARVFSDVAVKVAFCAPLFVYFFIRGRRFINLKYWRYALLFNLPLLPHYLSHFILTQSDRIMIGRMVGNAQAGLYSVAYTISTVVLLLVTAINGALTPYVYRVLHEKNTKKLSEMKTIVNPLSLMMALLCSLVALFAPEIIYLFAGVDYAEAIYIVPPVAASVYFIFAYSMFSNIGYFYKKTIRITIATTISALLNIILNFFFINKFGYLAAGYTTLVCYVFLAVAHFLFYKSIIRKKLPMVKQIFDAKIIFLFGFVMTGFLAVVVGMYSLHPLVRYVFVLAMIVVAMAKRGNIVHVLKVIKEGKK